MAVNKILLFLISGQFWLAAFLSLLTAFILEAGIGYGRGFGNYASIYLEDRRAQIELVVMFVVGLLAYSAIIQAVLTFFLSF
jgi:hypothetical protein